MTRWIALAIAVLMATAGSSAAASEPGWKMERSVDPVTDTKSETVGLEVGSDTLAFVCRSSEKRLEFSAVVQTSARLGRRGLRDLTYRLDSRPALTERWMYLPRAAVSADSGEAWRMVRRLLDGEVGRVLLRLRRFDGSFHDAEFPVDGAGRDLIRATAVSCGLK